MGIMCYVTAIILLVLFAFKATSLQFDHGNLKITNTVFRFFIVITRNPVAPWIGVGWCRRDGMSLKWHHLTTESMMSTKGLIIHGVAG